MSSTPDPILKNGRITTLDPNHPAATSIAVRNGRILSADGATNSKPGPNTTVIDLAGRRVIPGLNDSHLHVIRGGLNFNMELRWAASRPRLGNRLRMLQEQAQRTPPGQCSVCQRSRGTSSLIEIAQQVARKRETVFHETFTLSF
jgi:predicted amidohydrolase YtcJ